MPELETSTAGPGRRARGRRGRGRLALISAGLLALAVVAGACGSASSQSSGTTTTTAGSRAASFQAYRQCLAQHGATLPQGFGRRPGSGGTPGSPPSTFPRPSLTPQQQAALAQARAACQSKRPPGGFGRGRNGGALSRYLSCMRSKGIALGQGATVNRSDPAFIAANQQCRQYLPGGSPSPSSSA
jgi:hypothetical protein